MGGYSLCEAEVRHDTMKTLRSVCTSSSTDINLELNKAVQQVVQWLKAIDSSLEITREEARKRKRFAFLNSRPIKVHGYTRVKSL